MNPYPVATALGSAPMPLVLTFHFAMTHIAIELPEDIASRFGRQNELSRVALEALAAEGYRSGKLTHAEVQRMLGFASGWETDAFLKQAGAYLDYTESDLEHDLETSRQLSQTSWSSRTLRL